MPTREGSAATTTEPEEGLVEIDGLDHYAIPHVDTMPPFLMSVVSDGDRWMFASSSGALTAGRRDAAHAVFPYETDDRLHEAGGRLGPVTVLRVGDRSWQPFASGHVGGRRHLYKAVTGDSFVVEEHHDDLGLVVRSRWASCDRFGFVRTVTVTNASATEVDVDVLDGLVNVLPGGLEPTVTQRLSNLSNAYKRSELVTDRLAVFSLESPVSDRAEPEEVLRATTCWSTGLGDASVTLDAARIERFRRSEPGPTASVLTGRPGAYLLDGHIVIGAGASVEWRLVIDADRDPSDVVALRHEIDELGVDAAIVLDAETRAATDALVGLMALADAQQCTGDEVATAHHVANVTYNVMRGGVPLHGYDVDPGDLVRFVAQRNRPLAEQHASWFAALPADLGRTDAIERARATGDVHLVRLVREYLPFSFSRRHGDPSRPWNTFSIRVRDANGDPVVHYEGNWRDVFQNWEALCTTHPLYLPGVVSVFVDATTADGFNPYRITRDGIDWEVPDPDDPWANIGYWGDHQVVYLHRLLVACERYLPGSIDEMLAEAACTFADVPYRLAPYDDLLVDSKATITFDEQSAARSDERAATIGGDGRLLVDADGRIVTATLLEKLLITSLARLSNFVPGGGIWMNTQRPEWNDANNALVGNGLSMVTVCHLRAFLAHLASLVAARSGESFACSVEVADWLRAVTGALRAASSDDAHGRRRTLDALGGAFSDYRRRVYAGGFAGGSTEVSAGDVVELCEVAIAELDRTIRGARRDDGLVHAYNLLGLGPDTAEVRHLPEMLEGQVAALASGVLSPEEEADLVDALFASALFRPDQQTFLLAPARRLPPFVEKNVVPADRLDRAPVLRELLDEGSIVRRDVEGTVRFHPDLVDAERLDQALDALDPVWRRAVEAQRSEIHEVYESVFGHRAFLGRSGSMYGYEGIGSIYWHMVTKLLLAVQESAVAARDAGASADVVGRLVAAYERVRDGLGFRAPAERFGAVPTDPYSHTPAHSGAQQPGMTGAVKEELLARPLELGLRVVDGEIVLDPLLFGPLAEPVGDAARWRPIGVGGARDEITVPAGGWGLTVCQVPVVIEPAGDGEPTIEVETATGERHPVAGRRLGAAWSAEVFGRTGAVAVLRART